LIRVPPGVRQSGPAYADHYHRQIIFSAALVAAAFQLTTNFIEIVIEYEQLADFVVGNVTRDPVSAQQKLGPVLILHRFHVNFDALFGAERATDHVFARMVRGLFRRHASGADFFFDNRMIFGFAMQLTVGSETIKP
jgi:hypothetical protein